LITASKKQQGLVLRLSELDLQLSRTRNQLRSAETNSEIDELRGQSLQASEAMLAASSNVERLQDEVVKVLADIDMVEARILQDEKKAKAVNTDRELKAVELELASLQSRKAALEETELDYLQQIEDGNKALTEISQTRASISLKLEEELGKLHGQSLNLSAQVTELASKRESLSEEIEPSLLAIYDRKAERGVPVGQTLGRDCSACRLAINGVEFDAMMALPEDALPTCPNCDALIIR
jgi:predicted  nucleic acid-binding Zn-ribbon protein